MVPPDRHYTDTSLARLYDVLDRPDRRTDFQFYLPMVMSAASVLDVGCGTGALLRLAREAGHSGRLCGLDPADGMLSVARARPDIEWVLGDLSSVSWDQEFDLIVMTGHAFQVLVDDSEIRGALDTIRAALADSGTFAFETRNPLARAWEAWTAEQVDQVIDEDGQVIRMWSQVELPVERDVVRFTLTYASTAWDDPKRSHSTLRFLDAETLSSFLADAGFVIEEQYGDWDGQPFTNASPEIITIARPTVNQR